ncbi:MAG: hypothetical protein WAK07_15310 [Rhodomicrobium sp.]
MIERASPPKEQPVTLSLAAGQRIVMPGLDPVLGWIGGEKARVAQALVFPQWLLEPRPTETIVYACNLPAPVPGLPSTQIKAAGQAEASFVAASLPGGQVSMVSPEGQRRTLLFRWACVTAHASIGAVWHCFLKLRTPSDSGSWTAVKHDYVFEAGGGFLVNTPGSLEVTLGHAAFNLTHPEGYPTCFPAQSRLVKVARASADGWARRELRGLLLYFDRSIVARFSDSTERQIATAAPARAAAILAA